MSKKVYLLRQKVPLPTAECDLCFATPYLKDKQRKKGGVGRAVI